MKLVISQAYILHNKLETETKLNYCHPTLDAYTISKNDKQIDGKSAEPSIMKILLKSFKASIKESVVILKLRNFQTGINQKIKNFDNNFQALSIDSFTDFIIVLELNDSCRRCTYDVVKPFTTASLLDKIFRGRL